MPNLLSCGEAGRLIGVSEKTIKNWRDAGKLTHHTKMRGNTEVQAVNAHELHMIIRQQIVELQTIEKKFQNTVYVNMLQGF